MYNATDAAGVQLKIGDWIVDDRGKAWRIQDTEPAVLRSRVVRGMEQRLVRGRIQDVGESGRMVRLPGVYKVKMLSTRESNRAAWRNIYASSSQDAARAEISERRRSIRRTY